MDKLSADIERRVADAFAAALEIPAADADTDFFDEGGDSHLAVSLAISLTETFGIEVPGELIEDLSTVRNVAAWIDAELKN